MLLKMKLQLKSGGGGEESKKIKRINEKVWRTNFLESAQKTFLSPFIKTSEINLGDDLPFSTLVFSLSL